MAQLVYQAALDLDPFLDEVQRQMQVAPRTGSNHLLRQPGGLENRACTQGDCSYNGTIWLDEGELGYARCDHPTYNERENIGLLVEGIVGLQLGSRSSLWMTIPLMVLANWPTRWPYATAACVLSIGAASSGWGQPTSPA